MNINLSGTSSKKRNQFPLILKLYSASANIRSLKDLVTLNIENVKIFYSTSHFNGILFSGNVGDDLLDGTDVYIPESSEEKRNPRKEDSYLTNKLIEHLNSNLEHYNKVLWYNLDPDRRYMLLDGFNIQVFNDFGLPVDESGLPLPPRSLASVVKNELITITGNSLVFPVAAGYKISNSFITEASREGKVEVGLFEHYKPLTPIEPYRISVPSRGVFAEAVQGACNACEKIESDRLQDWNRFPNTDEPTPILPLNTPTPAITDWKAAFKDFASPMINIQNAPATPTPGAGLAGLSELLGKSGIFNDITGLDANQKNVLATYLSNQENAKAFAQMAKEMAMQAHNTENSEKIKNAIGDAKNSGSINKDDANKLTKDHIEQMIDGGESKRLEAEKADASKPTITEDAVKAVEEGKIKTVKAERTDAKTGKAEKVEVTSNIEGAVLSKYDAVEFKLRIFIPSPAVAIEIPVIGGVKAFSGDDREFAYNNKSSRAEIVFVGTVDPARSNESIIGIPQRQWGISHEYDIGDVETVAGKPSWWRTIKQGANPVKDGHLDVNDNNLRVEAFRDSGELVNFKITVGVSGILCKRGFN